MVRYPIEFFNAKLELMCLSQVSCVAITYNVEESLTEVGSCFYTKASSIIPKSLSELDEFMCGN